jgi:iron complex outermembrane recepter protein
MTVMACAAPLRTQAQAPAEPVLEEIVVTSERRALDSRAVAASLGSIPGERIAAIGAQHPFELFTRVPGMWLSRGSGQESLRAIRSPVLAGACGAVRAAPRSPPPVRY